MKKRGLLSILIMITLVIMTGLNEMSRSEVNADFDGYYADSLPGIQPETCAV